MITSHEAIFTTQLIRHHLYICVPAHPTCQQNHQVHYRMWEKKEKKTIKFAQLKINQWELVCRIMISKPAESCFYLIFFSLSSITQKKKRKKEIDWKMYINILKSVNNNKWKKRNGTKYQKGNQQWWRVVKVLCLFLYISFQPCFLFTILLRRFHKWSSSSQDHEYASSSFSSFLLFILFLYDRKRALVFLLLLPFLFSFFLSHVFGIYNQWVTLASKKTAKI